MIIAKGTRKVILTNPDAIAENELRYRANGSIFVPPCIVYVDGQRRPYTAHDVVIRGKSTLKHTPGRLPGKQVKNSHVPDGVRQWIETTSEVELLNSLDDIEGEATEVTEEAEADVEAPAGVTQPTDSEEQAQ